MKAVIVGGGIGGLAAALCLDHFGHEVRILERSAVTAEVGAGLQISPNGMRVLDRLGLSDAVAARAFGPESIEMRDGRTGGVIFDIPLADASVQRWGAPYYHIHRADLIEVLADAVERRMPGAMMHGALVTGCSQSGDEARAHYETAPGDGAHVETGDILIGADGIHSAIRSALFGPDAPRFTGNLAWRLTVPMAALGALIPPPTACAWVGRGQHCVTYRLRGGTMANLVAVVEDRDWRGEGWTEEGRREDALADFAGWHPVLVEMIRKAQAHYRWALFDRAPLGLWGLGRITLLGDACHPMLPFLAQGAVMAIEDAFVLARCLSGGDEAEAGLRLYEAARMPRTAKVQAASRANMGIFHRRSAVSRAATYAPMWLGGKIAPGLVRRRMDWLYGVDVTA